MANDTRTIEIVKFSGQPVPSSDVIEKGKTVL